MTNEQTPDAARVANCHPMTVAAPHTIALPHEDSAVPIAQTLEKTFIDIQSQRMHDVPVLNPALQVQAVGFRRHQDLWLGVLITPWFMNLLLLPADEQHWHEQATLSAHQHHFPSGRYRFIAAHETTIGSYRSCSLFSPMFEFADQTAAVETANAVLIELMNEANIDKGDIDDQEIAALWHPESTDATEANQIPAATDSDNAREQTPAPTEQQHESQIASHATTDETTSINSSRRRLLFGAATPAARSTAKEHKPGISQTAEPTTDVASASSAAQLKAADLRS